MSGSCFPKDIRALVNVARENDHPLKLIHAAEKVNELQKEVIIEKILKFYCSDLVDHLDQIEGYGENGRGREGYTTNTV